MINTHYKFALKICGLFLLELWLLRLQSMLVNQAIFNQKDLYILTSFFHKMHLNPNDIPNIEIFKNRLINDFYRFSSERRWQSKFSHNLKNRFTVTINEVEIIKENVIFKVPKKLN